LNNKRKDQGRIVYVGTMKQKKFSVFLFSYLTVELVYVV